MQCVISVSHPVLGNYMCIMSCHKSPEIQNQTFIVPEGSLHKNNPERLVCKLGNVPLTTDCPSRWSGSLFTPWSHEMKDSHFLSPHPYVDRKIPLLTNTLECLDMQLHPWFPGVYGDEVGAWTPMGNIYRSGGVFVTIVVVLFQYCALSIPELWCQHPQYLNFYTL